MTTWTREDLAWLGGLFEGEGCVVYGASHNGPLVAKISSTDLDVLERFRTVAQVGSISGPRAPHRSSLGVKPFWTYVVRGRQAYALLVALWPWLGERRREQVATKIRLWHTRPLRAATVATPETVAEWQRLRDAGATLSVIAEQYGVTFGYVAQRTVRRSTLLNEKES